MYEAVRPRAPHSTKLVGFTATVLMTATVGYALMNGFGEQVARMVQSPIVFTPLEDRSEPPPEQKRLETTDETLSPTPPITIPDQTWAIEDPPETTIFVSPGETAKTGSGNALGAGTTPAPLPVRRAPKLLKGDPPDYPAPSIRAGEQGVSRLEVCVDARGRVTSASLAASSGYSRLDNAALKWIRGERFAPGTLDGAAQSICGHDVVYEWNLKDARK
jgi:periplasmic protein TonB